jgi:hypothetical protein
MSDSGFIIELEAETKFLTGLKKIRTPPAAIGPSSIRTEVSIPGE